MPRKAKRIAYNCDGLKYTGEGVYDVDGEEKMLDYFQVQWEGVEQADAERKKWFASVTDIIYDGLRVRKLVEARKRVEAAKRMPGRWHRVHKGRTKACVSDGGVEAHQMMTIQPINGADDDSGGEITGKEKHVMRNGFALQRDENCALIVWQHAAVHLVVSLTLNG